MSHEKRGHGAAYRHLTALALMVWTLAGCAEESLPKSRDADWVH